MTRPLSRARSVRALLMAVVVGVALAGLLVEGAEGPNREALETAARMVRASGMPGGI